MASATYKFSVGPVGRDVPYVLTHNRRKKNLCKEKMCMKNKCLHDCISGRRHGTTGDHEEMTARFACLQGKTLSGDKG